MKRYSSSASISPMMASGLLMVKTAQLPTSRVLKTSSGHLMGEPVKVSPVKDCGALSPTIQARHSLLRRRITFHMKYNGENQFLPVQTPASSRQQIPWL